ncbi:DNA-3-methyladenine glycosylase family protein [Tahibacter amnicola]|uniref:DNA-3-methyladenine glycosylase II n=1 Tax=Tahibacter amnicola TaxID=2976241 RepID=A0ABY6BL68_9GAMM|nr:AlkA N-terminal domain-containing protein [Tahibacter amnicola]UXI69130.1 hypothetical protein N4264_05625 [Tahibacter amnicola]
MPAPLPLHQHRLAIEPAYDWNAVLRFFERRAIPGVESVDGSTYRRVFVDEGTAGWFSVTQDPDDALLRVTVSHPSAASAARVCERARDLFDLDTDMAAVRRRLRRDPRLAPGSRRHPDIRVPGCWNGFELAVRAVLGQQITVAAARTLAARIVARHGHRPDSPYLAPADAVFPDARVLADADLDGLGLTGARIATLHTVARAVVDGALSFEPEQPLETFVERCVTLRGIGPWTAHYMAMRALRHRDAFPAADIVLRKVLQPGHCFSAAALERESQAWRPYRAYAVLLLWRMAG